VVGLRDSWEAPKVSSTTRVLPGGKIPTTGSTTTEDIGQAEQVAFRVVQGRPTQCRHVYLRSDTCLGTRGTFTRSASERDAATYLSRPTPTPRFANRSAQRRTVGGCDLYAVCTYYQALLERRNRRACLQRHHVPPPHLPHHPHIRGMGYENLAYTVSVGVA
jgi:hypothetical protein